MNIQLKKFVSRLILSGMLLGLNSLTALAGAVDCGSGPIRLAFFEFGLFYFEKDGQSKGIDKDVVDELTKRTGCTFKTQVLPRARIWRDLKGGNLDMTVAAVQNPERDSYAWFVPYLAAKNYALLRTTTASAVRSAGDFLNQNELQFGVVRGFKHEETLDIWLERMRKSQRVQESTEVELLFRKLKMGRIDGIFSQPYVYRKFIKEMKMEGNVVIQDWAPKEKGVVGNIMFSKRHFSKDDAARWQTVMHGLRADGTLKRIFMRYMPEEDVKNLLNF